MTDPLKTDIPGLLSLVEITVPSWAADEPVPGEMIAVAPIPDDLEEQRLSTGSRSQHYDLYGGHVAHLHALQPKLPTESVVKQSIYDKDGKLLEVRQFEGGELIEVEKYIYDTSGKILERVTSFPLEELEEREVRQYDQEGRLARTRIRYADETELETSYKWQDNVCDETSLLDGVETRVRKRFDDQGRIIERVELSKENGYSGETTQCDGNGRVVEIRAIAPDGSNWLRELYEYDETGREIRWSMLNEDGETIQQKETTYDHDRAVSDVLFENDNETSTIYEYDVRGLLIRSFSLSERSQAETVNAYNERGLIAMTATRSAESETWVGRGASVVTYRNASTTWYIYEFYEKH